MANDVHTHTGNPVVGSLESIPDLLKRLRDDTTVLVRQEMALAKTEMSEKASRVGKNVAYLAVGAVVALMGIFFLLWSATAGLTIVLAQAGLESASFWLAPLIVGLVVAIIGYAFVQKAISTLKRESLAPEKTKDSLNRDKEWIKNKVQ